MEIKNVLQKPFLYTFSNMTIGLIILNVGLFLMNMLFNGKVTDFLALYPPDVLSRGFIWQPVTYMFMHLDYSHIIFNMLGLFIFGLPLEKRMGSREFLLYYLLTGTLTGIIAMFILPQGTLLGASGAIYALLLAYAAYYPDSQITVFFVLPLPAPIAVLVFAGISLFMQITSPGSGVAHFAHLAGIVFGFLYFLIRLRTNVINVFFKKR